MQDNFLRIPEGWISEFSADGKTRLVVKMDAEAISVASAKKTKSNDGIMTLEDELGNSGFTYDSSIGTVSGTEAYDRANRGVFADSGQLRTDAYSPGVVNEQYLDAVAALNITKLNGIMGMPYQWMPHVDPRIRTKSDQSSGEIGRVYSERVIARMPLLVIAPGEPEFLAGFSSDEKKNVLEAIVSDIGKNVLTTGGESELDRLLGDEGKYYSFRYAGNKYFQYLNPIRILMAFFAWHFILYFSGGVRNFWQHELKSSLPYFSR